MEDVEYEAFCEGDDYWIDPLKLQKQVDYLDSHPECGMCYTNFNILNQDKGTMLLDVANSSPVEFPMHYTLEQFIMKKGYVCPPSWVYRRKNFLTIQRLKNSCDGTFEIFCHFLATTKVQYLDFISSVYRVLKESASHCSDVNKLAARRKSMLQMQKDLIDKYGLPPELVRECSLKYYKNNLTFHLDNGFLDDVAEARAYLQKEASFKERIIFFLSDSRTGMFIYRQIRKITTLYRH